MISNIQVLRGLAALAVVFYHTDFRIFNDVHTDFEGVSIFFVISGFIMTYILQSNNKQFMLRRIVRIVPLYWIITIAAYTVVLLKLIVKDLIRHENLSSIFSSELTTTTFWVVLKSLLFFPYIDSTGNYFPYLGVGWTLNLEMFFYVLIAIMIMFSKKWAILLACFILIILKLIDYTLGHSSIVISVYSHSYTTFFILGALSYYLWPLLLQNKTFCRKIVLIPISIITVLCFLFFNIFNCFPNIYVRYLMPFAILIIALLCHSSGMKCTWKPLLVLGNISYALYLVHSVWIELQRFIAIKIPILNFLFNFKENIYSMLIVLFMSCLLAIFIHYKIEKPIIKKLQKLLLDKEAVNHSVVCSKPNIMAERN